MHSVTIALRHFALGVDPTAAYWDFDLLDGHGGWRAEGCHITGSGGNTTTIHCTHHNNFAVLMVSSLLCGASFIHFSTTIAPTQRVFHCLGPIQIHHLFFHHGINGVTCFKRHFMQGPLKSSFIVAVQQRERICQIRCGDLLALWSMRCTTSPYSHPGDEKLRVLYSPPPFFSTKKQHSS